MKFLIPLRDIHFSFAFFVLEGSAKPFDSRRYLPDGTSSQAFNKGNFYENKTQQD
jgi:hypothetical protein